MILKLSIAIPFSVFFLFFGIGWPSDGEAQQLSIENGKHKIWLIKSTLIGLTTAHDTVKYGGEKNLSFIIFKLDSSSLTIRRPTKYVDTVIQYYEGVYSTLPFEFQVGRFFRRDRIQYVHLLKLTEFESRTYPFREITSITYPTETAHEEGCIGCFFIPGINIWYLISATNKIKPKKREMSNWKFTVE